MTNKEAFELIGKRVEELVKRNDVQRKMEEIAKTEGKEKAEKYVYMLAVATLAGI